MLCKSKRMFDSYSGELLASTSPCFAVLRRGPSPLRSREGESKKRGLPGSAPFAAFGLAMPRDKDSAQAEIEVFSKSLNAWVPGKVWLFASAGKITVTYAVNGHRCRKHLYPWTQQIRSVGEMDPDSAVLDMEDMQQEVEVVGDMLPSWGEEADPEFSFTHLWDALFCEMPMNATLKNAMQAARPEAGAILQRPNT